MIYPRVLHGSAGVGSACCPTLSQWAGWDGLLGLPNIKEVGNMGMGTRAAQHSDSEQQGGELLMLPNIKAVGTIGVGSQCHSRLR